MTFIVSRYHDFSAGHRVVGHENKCSYLHGHNYRVHFRVRSIFNDDDNALDRVGRVIDFSAVKKLGLWLEDNWDHKMLLWNEDIEFLQVLYHRTTSVAASVVEVPFNPTAENMAAYLVRGIAPLLLPADVLLFECTVEETRKCSATYSL